MVGSYRLRSQNILAALCLLGIFTLVSTEKLRDFGAQHYFLHADFDKSKNPVLNSAHAILHNRGEAPFEIPLEVNVILVGFNGDGGYRYELDDAKFLDFLQASYPIRRPSCLETGEPLQIEHPLIMNVTKASTSDLLEIERAVKSAMVTAVSRSSVPGGSKSSEYEVEATKIEPLLDSKYAKFFGVESKAAKTRGEQHPTALFVLNFDKVRMDPTKQGHAGDTPGYRAGRLSREDLEKQEGNYTYLYRYMGSASTQAWIAGGRFLVVDLSAGPCSFGRVNSDRGFVGPGTIPRLNKAILPVLRSHPDNYVEYTTQYVQAQLAGVVASAIDHVLAPDVNFEVLDLNSRVLISVVVLQNHHLFHPLKPGHSHFLNLTLVKQEVQKLAPPDQEVIVVGGTHGLDEHEHLAIAVAKALRWQTRSPTKPVPLRFQAELKPYIDGAVLMDEFRHSTDMLAAGLLDATEPDLASNFFVTHGDDDDEDRADAGGTGESGGGGGGVSMHVKTSPGVAALDFSRRERKARYKAALANPSPRPPATRKSDGSRIARMHGTRVIPVFVLSLAGVDERLLMDGDTALEIAHDGVIVLQVVNGSADINFVSHGNVRLVAQTSDPTREVLAGVAAVLGSLTPPWARLSPVPTRHPDRQLFNEPGSEGSGQRQRGVVEDWLWASGHHPFGPFTNCTGLSQIFIDNSHRNAISSTVDVALHGIQQSLQALQAYADNYFITPLGSPVNQPGSSGRSSADTPWIDKLYSNKNDMPRIISEEVIKEIEDMLNELESELGRIGQKLQTYEMEEAHALAEGLLDTARNFHAYVILGLDEASDSMRCCSVKHKMPRKVSNAVLYAGILAAGFVVYFLVIYFSSPER